MTITFTQRVSVPLDVLVTEVGGESVLLNLRTESYFGLDDVGTRMWQALTTSDSIQAAFEALQARYDVSTEQLRSDLNELMEKLVEQGLVEICEE